MFTIVNMVVVLEIRKLQGGIAMTAFNQSCPSCWNFPTARTSARWALVGLGVGAFIIAMLSI
ncbi:MAG: hypothetical protein KDA16_03635 [Phycisphaerales bacterium]|nr:hypothetical protein [Phycisphaerales bacterium]